MSEEWYEEEAEKRRAEEREAKYMRRREPFLDQRSNIARDRDWRAALDQARKEEDQLQSEHDCRFTPKVGDMGQRYQVEGKLPDGQWQVVGWSQKPDGGMLADATRLWPRFVDVRIVDREKGSE